MIFSRLSDLAVDMRSGFACGEEDSDGLVQFRMNNVTRDGALDWSKLRRVPRSRFRTELQVLPGDVLFNATNSRELVGKSALFTGYTEPVTFSNHFVRLRLDETRVEPGYAARFLQRQFAAGVFANMCRSWVNQASISTEQFGQVLIPLPPLDEQRRITAILDRADQLRRKQLHALALLRELRHALYRESFATSSSDEPRFPSALFGDLVADTKIGLVRGVSELGTGLTHPYVRMNAITRDQEIDFSTVMTTEASETEWREYSLLPGDFLFNTRNSRDLVGKSALWPGPNGYLFNNNIMRVRFKSVLEPAYVLAAFRDPRVLQEIENRKSGTTSVFAIYWQQLKTVPIPLPPLAAQKAFADRIARVEALKDRCRQRLAKFDELFASLQYHAFAGTLNPLPIEATVERVTGFESRPLMPQ